MNVCEQCGAEFQAPKGKSRRRTCSRKCAAALSWKNPGTREKRRASIRATKLLPKYRKIAIEANHRRWARPGEREKLAERNRNETPEQRAARGRAIAARWAGDPELTKLASDFRRAWWSTPGNRDRATTRMQAVHQTPEAKAAFRARMEKRWRDPKMRARFIKKLRERMADPVERDKQSRGLKSAWKRRRAAQGKNEIDDMLAALNTVIRHARNTNQKHS